MSSRFAGRRAVPQLAGGDAMIVTDPGGSVH
jgi:hypothetical protein